MPLIPHSIATETKLTPTHTLHMITSYIFLHWLLACWTFPGKLLHPQLVVFLLIRQLTPLLHLKTRCWLMWLFLAFETVHSAAWALDEIVLYDGGFLAE